MQKFLDFKGVSALIAEIKRRIASKQDAEPGKQLSTEDYTTAEKEKLENIAETLPEMQEQINGLKIKKATISQKIVAETRIIHLQDFPQNKYIILGAVTNTRTSSVNSITVHPIFDYGGVWGLRCDPTYGTVPTDTPLDITIYYIDMPVFEDAVSAESDVAADKDSSESDILTEDKESEDLSDE